MASTPSKLVLCFVCLLVCQVCPSEALSVVPILKKPLQLISSFLDVLHEVPIVGTIFPLVCYILFIIAVRAIQAVSHGATSRTLVFLGSMSFSYVLPTVLRQLIQQSNEQITVILAQRPVSTRPAPVEVTHSDTNWLPLCAALVTINLAAFVFAALYLHRKNRPRKRFYSLK